LPPLLVAAQQLHFILTVLACWCNSIPGASHRSRFEARYVRVDDPYCPGTAVLIEFASRRQAGFGCGGGDFDGIGSGFQPAMAPARFRSSSLSSMPPVRCCATSSGADRAATRGAVALVWRRATYVQGNRPAMNRRKAKLANSPPRETSARTQPANSFIVSLRLGDGLGMQIFVPPGFWRSVCSTPWANPLQKFSLAKLA
jgi:hypothetical protein